MASGSTATTHPPAPSNPPIVRAVFPIVRPGSPTEHATRRGGPRGLCAPEFIEWGCVRPHRPHDLCTWHGRPVVAPTKSPTLIFFVPDNIITIVRPGPPIVRAGLPTEHAGTFHMIYETGDHWSPLQNTGCITNNHARIFSRWRVCRMVGIISIAFPPRLGLR